MKRIIRRYANRRMYDAQARRSITLSGIADLLREGAQVQVVDHTTGVDITSLTLSKVLMEQVKVQKTSVWGSFLLQELIRWRGKVLLELAERSLSTSLEAIATAEGKLKETIRLLVSSRKINRREGQKLFEKAQARLTESKTNLHVQLERILQRAELSAR